MSEGHSVSAMQPRQTYAVASQNGVVPTQSLASRQPTQLPAALPLGRQCGVDGETAAQAPSGSDVDKQETQTLTTQMGAAPAQLQPVMSKLTPARSAPPSDVTWHSRSATSQAKPLGQGRVSSQ